MIAARVIRPSLSARGVISLALWLGFVLPQAATAARWFDSLPADDPDMVVRHEALSLKPVAPTMPRDSASLPGSVANFAGSMVGAAYGATTGILWSVVGGIGSVASGTGEALWETAYMFGINRTPVPRTSFSDPIPDLEALADDGAQPMRT